MDKQKNSEDKLYITFADILSLFKKSRLTLFKWMIAFAFLGALVALTKPIRYKAEATFREKSIKPGVISNSLIQLFGNESASGQEQEAVTMIKSRRILQEVIEKMHLQAVIVQQCKEEHLVRLMRRNVQLAWAAFKKSAKPVLADPSCPLKIVQLSYKGEIPLAFNINLKRDGEFDVRDAREGNISYGQGRLGHPFKWEQLNFTLASDQKDLPPQLFSLKVDSLPETVKRLGKELLIENEKNDKGVLRFTYMDRDRYRAADFINLTLDYYQNYQKVNHDKLARLQLDYLHSRQGELASNLNSIMQKHASFLANDLYNSGFIDSDKEMEFLAKSQHEYRGKLLANELEIKRLESLHPNSIYESYQATEGNSTLINHILVGIRENKQRRDALEIEIQKKGASHSDELKKSFESQIAELKEVQQYTHELQDLLDRFYQHLPPNPSPLLNDPRFLMAGWFERLDRLELEDPVEWQKTRDSFQFYLTNLERLFSVHEKILLERLTHQQNPTLDYQGIDIKLSEELYADFSRQLIRLESTIRQNLFYIKQLGDPSFEMTSLSSDLTDNVSQDMIGKASTLVLTLKDLNNQSVREQQRLKDELKLQKSFLTLHLEQMVALMDLQKQVLEEKIFALQNVSLELIHQNISLQETTLKDYIASWIENLRQERTLIKQHLRQIHKEMAGLPNKWVAEKLIQQEVETNRMIVEEIAKMVESKNITHNLEVIQSAPIDIALPPVYPLSPNPLFAAVLGGIFGMIIGSGFILGSTLRKGMRASPDNLKLMGLHVSGLINSKGLKTSPPSSKVLETLRRLNRYVEPQGGLSQHLLLILGEGPDYSARFSELLKKQSKRTIVLNLDFNAPSEKKEGLLPYLEGKISFPSIIAGEAFDQIEAGGTTSFAIECLTSPYFIKLIKELEGKYDWIICKTHRMPASGEAESLIPFFGAVAVSITEEKTDELRFYEQWAGDLRHKITFLFANG
ncbi:MAG: hypothetical protein LW832_08105 [Parachlamydia sp.]|nr:hypothetical protein [Parachlamydia sp.]